MSEIFKLHIKIILRSFWVYLAIAGVLALSLLSYLGVISSGVPSVGLWIQLSTYPLLYGMLCFVMMGVQLSKDSSEFIKSLNIKYLNLVFGKLLAIIAFQVFVILIPIFIILSHYAKYGGISIALLINFIIEILMIWGIAFIVSSALGFFIGTIVKNKLAYIGAFAGWYLITPYPYKGFTGQLGLPSKVLSLFSQSVYDINGAYEAINGFVFDRWFILDKVFAVVMILILINVCVLKNDMKYTKFKIYLKYLISLVVLITVNATIMIYESKDTELVIDKSNNTIISNDKTNDDISIVNYKMDLEIANDFRNKAEIKVVNNGQDSVKTITMNLDKAFSISEVLSDNKKIDYTVKDSLVTIKLDKAISKNEFLDLHIEYSGKLNYKDKVGNKIYYAGDGVCFLTKGVTWYPTINDKQKDSITFDVNIKSANEVVCNLDRTSEDENFKSRVTKYNGKSDKLFLLSGYLGKTVSEKSEIYGAEELITNNKVNYDKIVQYMKENKFVNLNQYMLGKNKKIVFVPFSFKDEKVIYDDYILINQNFLWNYVALHSRGV